MTMFRLALGMAGRRATAYFTVCVVGAASCASSGGLFHLGPRPPELVGIWIDSAKATPTDTVAWVLNASGIDRTLHIRVRQDKTGRTVVARDEKQYGLWYLSGSLADSVGRELCFKRRARQGGSCFHFGLDTVSGQAAGPVRRRLRILNYRGTHHTRDRVLLERLP